MDERDFEDRLKTRLHARFDDAEPAPALNERISLALRTAEPRHLGPWLRAATAVAAVALIAAILAWNGVFGGVVIPGATPSAASSASARATPGSTSRPSSAVPTPPGSVPPSTTAAWTGLSITRMSAGPTTVASIVDWAGGYLALPPTGDSSDPPISAWISRDGRTWVALPADQFNPPGAFGLPSQEQAAPCLGGIVVATDTDKGQQTLWYSIDGRTWTARQAPLPLQLTGFGDFGNSMMAGNATGIVAVQAATEHSLAFSADCITWQAAVPPGATSSTISGVASVGQDFVAIDASGTNNTGSPMAWVSADGRNWSTSTVQRLPGDAFIGALAGSNGLVAESFSGGVPGLVTFWSSPDGRSWKTSKADPLGINQDGEGVGSAKGFFAGDGTRILAYGSRSGSQQTEYWVSMDGTNWTKLGLSGDTSSISSGLAKPFLLHDGILFNDGSQSWFGAALK
jgi:hypothetical protein